MQKITPPVDITIHSRRRRLADPDGISGKWVVDAIVSSGIIPDDSAKYVKKVSFTQTKVSVSEPETTTVTITEVGHAEIQTNP